MHRQPVEAASRLWLPCATLARYRPNHVCLLVCVRVVGLSVGRARLPPPDNGDMVMEAVVTDVPHNHTPVLVNNGVVTCQGPTGSISSVTLKTHNAIVVSTRD